MILSDEDWEAWGRLQEERAEEEYHERRYAEKTKMDIATYRVKLKRELRRAGVAVQNDSATEMLEEMVANLRHCPNCRYDTKVGDCCSHPANDGTVAFWERTDESKCFAPKGAV